jgi:anaerobic magnesium-protoporphyrin IX monomethyl ester cyclase
MSIILLEHPRPKNPERFEDVVNTPLSSCLMTGYIASVLKSKNLDVEIIDANLYGWSFYKTVQELKKKTIKLLGIHLVYLWDDTEDVFEVIKELRSNGVKTHINLYGHFPAFAFEKILSNYSVVDSITIGEPEYTFLELAEAVINNKDSSALFSIDGLAFNSLNSKVNPPSTPFVKSPLNPPFTKGGEGGLRGILKEGFSFDKHGAIKSEIERATLKPAVIKNKPREPISNLDSLPFPYRYCFEIFKGRGVATYVLASRGCYGECTFCYLNQFYAEESLWRGRSPENVINEICHLYREYGERYFYFADANFFGPGRKGKNRVCELARLIIDTDIKINFGIECRVNDIEDEVISMLVRAGLRDVFLGIESGNQNSLERFRKNTTVEDNKRAINILRRYNIEPNCGFIIFEPDSTLEDIRENFEFLKEMKMLSSPSITAHLLYHRQTVFKGTFDYENMKDVYKSVCRFNYEYVYVFKDERVGALADNVKAFCSTVLKDLSGNRGLKKERNSCLYDENDSFSRNLNRKLIEHFEKALSLFG